MLRKGEATRNNHSPFFCKTLERRGRGMDSIISLVGDGGKSKILVAEVTKTANAGEEN
jgi:hypothetical protein